MMSKMFYGKRVFIHLDDQSMESLTANQLHKLGAKVVKKVDSRTDILLTGHKWAESMNNTKQKQRSTMLASNEKVIQSDEDETKRMLMQLTMGIGDSSLTNKDTATKVDKTAGGIQQPEATTKEPQLPPILLEAQKLGVMIVSYAEFSKRLATQQRMILSPKRKAPNVTRLTGPFIKLEDRSRKYRPHVQTLAQWPKINITPGIKGCIFASGKPEEKGASADDKDSSPESPTKKRKLTRNIGLDRDQQGQEKTKASGGLKTSTPKEFKADRRQDRPGYCELCEVRFENRDVHLDSDEHKSHYNDDCFKELDEEMNSGPTLASFYFEVTGKVLPKFEDEDPK